MKATTKQLSTSAAPLFIKTPVFLEVEALENGVSFNFTYLAHATFPVLPEACLGGQAKGQGAAKSQVGHRPVG